MGRYAPQGRTAGSQAVILVLLTLLAGIGFSLTPGTFTDYVWQGDYHAPASPPNQTLSCQEFQPNSSFCDQVDTMGPQQREQLILASLYTPSPEESQDLVRQHNSGLGIGAYYENVSITPGGPADGAWGENGSLRNMWFRLIQIYPSVYDERDGYFYVGDQPGVQTQTRLSFVVANPTDGEWCAQKYDIKGYDVSLTKSVGSFSTMGRILPVATLLKEGEKTNLTLRMSAIGEYGYELSAFSGSANSSVPGGSGNETAPTPRECVLNVTNHTVDTLTLSRVYPIKRYPTTLQYEHVVSVPPSGFAQGIVRLKLPSDFLSYEIRIKGYTFSVSRHDLKFVTRGQLEGVLGLDLISSPGRSGTLRMSGVNESDDGIFYTAELRYKLPVEAPDIGPQDCSFTLRTPFGTKQIPDPTNPDDVGGGCQPTRSPGQIVLSLVEIKDNSGLVRAVVEDPLGNKREGAVVVFTAQAQSWQKPTNSEGVAEVWIPQTPSMMEVQTSLIGSQDVTDAQAMLFLPGKGTYVQGEKSLLDMTWERAPILLILLLISSLMVWLVRRRSSAVLLLILILAAALPALWAQEAGVNGTNDVIAQVPAGGADSGGIGNLQMTMEACRNYDFNNAVRHFGECTEAYQLSQEFSSMRTTAVVLIANIAPLVVATPDITPYQDAYANMMRIALALFRVAWAFNSLYLILNIFNPAKRNEALKQYVWLLVFVIFAFFSFSLIRESINAINSISTWIAGTNASSTLTQASLSAEFVAENYEMLKLVLPFLNITYLVLLARYVSVIGMMLFFPFSLLLFFTSATRGFGRAALTVTFASLGLGVINAILLLIYSILAKTTDPALAGSFATTFFSASFIIFFGFVNLLVLCVAFLSGIVFIGAGRGGEG